MARQSPRSHAHVVMMCALSVWVANARADGAITRRGEIVAKRHRMADDDRVGAELPLGEGRVRSLNLLRAVTGLSFGVVTSTIGATRSGIAGTVTVDGVSVRYPLGGGDIGKIQAASGPNSRARLGFTLVDLPAVFSCRDPNGALHPPIFGHMLVACVPGARLGVGAVIGALSWDPEHHRRTARWADLAAVVNLIGATTSMAYLRGHLDVSLRLGVDSIWHGDNDRPPHSLIGSAARPDGAGAIESRSGADHMVRAGVALDGVLRSENARWEATLQAAFRPTVFGTVPSFRDYGWAAEATAVYQGIIDATVISIGLDLRATYWSDPSTSLNSLDTIEATPAVFAGAILRVKRESKP